MKIRNYFLMVVGILAISFSTSYSAHAAWGDPCTVEQQAHAQKSCTSDPNLGEGWSAIDCRQGISGDNGEFISNDGFEWVCARLGITFHQTSSPGATASYDFTPGEDLGVMNGGWHDPICTFTCTGVGSGLCPASEPFIFEENSQPGQPLQCTDGHFQSNTIVCQQLAEQTCQQTFYHPPSNTNNDSGKVDIDGNQHSTPPTPTGTPSPGEMETYDFGAVFGNGMSFPYCNFSCTGIGSFCPDAFQETSQPGLPLNCSNGLFQGDLESCQSLAEQSCQQTTAYSDVVSGGIIFDSTWNALTSVDHLISQTAPSIQVQSILSPKGETLETAQYFNNLAIQQLIEKNNTATIKK